MMAETITLQAYLNDLRGMVENESPTEAVSHCRYILQHYPQNVATYRLLGRALLQKGHHEALPEHFVQAADIFQRVLSVIPDDGIAHLALSEIREQEGAIDQAIWHMERAQEQLPGNTVIDEALRKLYGRRPGQAGAEAGKLQLSQSALARQYANSQLYDEAVLELRRALHTDPERVDLQVLLAKLLWESQHRVEAGEVALEVLRRLPDCLDANALMARLWLAYGRPSDAQPYLDRVAALDPYAAARILQPDGDARDPNVLPRLDYTARAAAALSTETPEWVHDLDSFDDAALFAPGGTAVDQIDTDAVFGAQAEPATPADWVQDLYSPQDETPDWFAEPAALSGEQLSSEPAPAAWLDDLEDEPAEAALPQPSMSDLLETTPDWFEMAAEVETGEASDEDRAFALPEESVSDGPEPAPPDWFAGLGDALSAEDAPTEAQALDPLAWLDEDTEPDALPPAADAPADAMDAAWLAFGAEAERGAPGAEAEAGDAEVFGPEDDEIADLDRLFEALNAAEYGQTGTPPGTAEVATDDDEAHAAAPPSAPSDDWLAIFQQTEPAGDVGLAVPTDADALPWDAPSEEAPQQAAFLAEDLPWALPSDEAPDAEQTEAPPAAAFEADAAPPEARIEEETDFDAEWAAFEMSGEPAPTGEVADAAAEEAPLAAEDQEISTGDLFGEATAPADDDLFAALSQTTEDEADWLRQFDVEAEQLASPQDQAGAEADAEQAAAPQDQAVVPETLSDEDIFAIFGEPVEPALPAAPASEDVFNQDALSHERSGAEFDEFAWPDSETEAAGVEPPDSEPQLLDQMGEPASEEWLAALNDEEGAVHDDFTAFAAEDEDVSEHASVDERPSLFGLARAADQAQQQADVPDWMTGLEMTGSASEDEILGGSVEDVYDPFEGGDPSAVPTYESAGHTGVLQPDEAPDWMGAFEAEPAVEDESAAEDVVLDFAAAGLVDEPDDALDVFDTAAQPPEVLPREPAAAETFGAIEWDMPGDDLFLGVDPEPRAEADADIPDWLSAITQAATQDDAETLPDVDDVLAVSDDAEAVPEWLREIEEPAADDDAWAIPADAPPDGEALAPAADLADTRDALPSLAEDEDDFDGTFSFADREPTWLRRAPRRPDGGFESA